MPLHDGPQIADGYPRPFGNYVLLSAFAHGGMGEVYLAKTGGIEGIERVCVLKKLRPDFGQNPEYVNRFLDEARLVVQLNHANIAHVFDVGKVAGEYYLAMEYVAGVSLRGLLTRSIERGSALPIDVALYMLCESLEALDYAHRLEHPMTGKALNLVHRDVSPHNVMVSYEGEVKLIDFGLAASELKEEQTESQVVMGKVAYMSPEQARGERVDGRCDQFAAGIMAYELLGQDRYYGEMSNYQIWQVVGRGGFTPRAWSALDAELQPILSRALHGDPSKRFPTCGDFKEALLDWLVARYPRTSRRTVRETVRALFDEDTDKERLLLQRVSSVSAASVREGIGPAANTQSYSIVRAPGSNPPAAAPGAAISEQPDTESTGTHLLPRHMRKRQRAQRRALAAGLALVVVGGVSGFLLMRATTRDSGDKRLETAAQLSTRATTSGAQEAGSEGNRAADVAAAERSAPPRDDDEPALPPANDDDDAAARPADSDAPAALAVESNGEHNSGEHNSGAHNRGEHNRGEHNSGAQKSGEQKSGEQKSAASKSGSEKTATTTSRSQGTRPASGDPGSAKTATQPPVPDDDAQAAAAASAKTSEQEGWRMRVVRRLESCPPCAKTFLERVDLRTLPAAKLEQVRVSVETCLKQCE